MVRHLVRALLDAGRTPAIAMRGYASRNGVSDEADEYRRSIEGVPVVAQPNRAEGLLDLFATDAGHAVDCVVLDDGFQHRRLARCFDLVLIDATRDPFSDHLLPRGWLREGPDALARAHAVAITRADAREESHIRDIAARARRINPRLVIAAYRHAWTGLVVHQCLDGTALSREASVEWLRGKRPSVACAIANPDALLAMVRAAAGETSGTVVLPDHDAYDGRVLKRVIELSHSSEALLVTDKDWSKLARVRPELWGCPVVVPRVEMEPMPDLLPMITMDHTPHGQHPHVRTPNVQCPNLNRWGGHAMIETAAIAAILEFDAAHSDPHTHT